MMWLAGPIVWALHFAFLYGSEWLACTRGSAGLHTILGSAATLLALVVLVGLIVHGRGRRAFVDRIGIMLCLAAVAALLASYLPILMAPACLLPA